MGEKCALCEDGVGALIRLGVRFAVYSVLFALLAIGMMSGAVYCGTEFYSETGPVEILEAFFALTTAVFFLLAARRDPQRVPFAVLCSGFLFCVYIRESDYFLDRLLFRHAWKAGVLLTLILTGGYAWRVRRQIQASLCQFIHHPASGIFMAGVLVLFVFSRLFGYGDAWEGIVLDGKWMIVKELVLEHTDDITYTLLMEDKCLTIKRIVEESSEQIGYFLMVIAAFEYWLDARRADLFREKKGIGL
jgi:hypothetical protein